MGREELTGVWSGLGNFWRQLCSCGWMNFTVRYPHLDPQGRARFKGGMGMFPENRSAHA